MNVWRYPSPKNKSKSPNLFQSIRTETLFCKFLLWQASPNVVERIIDVIKSLSDLVRLGLIARGRLAFSSVFTSLAIHFKGLNLALTIFLTANLRIILELTNKVTEKVVTLRWKIWIRKLGNRQYIAWSGAVRHIMFFAQNKKDFRIKYCLFGRKLLSLQPTLT